MATIAHDRPMLTIRETADRLSLSESTVRRLVAAQVLPARRIGGSLRVEAAELDEWLNQASTVGPGSSAGSTEPAPGPGSSDEGPQAARRVPDTLKPAVEAPGRAQGGSRREAG
jgi:excisionase family DNA binding protein